MQKLILAPGQQRMTKLSLRRKSEPSSTKAECDSDEHEIEELDYKTEFYHGWNSEANVPAPVQLKRPNRCFIRRTGDKLHLAVWDNDPGKAQKLILQQGINLTHL